MYIQNRSLLDENQATAEGVEPRRRTETLAIYLVNGFLGAVAACVSWAAFYGATATANIAISTPGVLTTLAGAFSVGLGGTKWLQSERDKGRWQAVTSQVAVSRPDPKLQAALSLASSDEAVQIAKAALETGREGPGPTGGVRRPSSGSAGGQAGTGAGGGQGGVNAPYQPRGAAAGAGGATAGGLRRAGATGGIPNQPRGLATGSGGGQGGARIPNQPRGLAVGSGRG